MKLAIVGSTQFDGDIAAEAWATALINDYLTDDVTAVVSGGAKGIDTLAVNIARSRGLHVYEYLPRNPRWEPSGYKDRNLLIAQECDVLLCLRHHASKTYGSGWTADQAAKFGKSVHKYMYKG